MTRRQAARAVGAACLLLAVSLPLSAQGAPEDSAGYARLEMGEFYPFEIDPRAFVGFDAAPVRPLTPADRIEAHEGHFYRVGADETVGTDDDSRVRFFGVNLSFDANFPEEADARALADTLSKLGVNAVRLHHLDSRLTPLEDRPRGVLATGPYPTWHEQGLRRLRGLIEALADKGIYVNLNLRVGYRIRPEVDALPELDESRMHRPNAAPLLNFHPEGIQRQIRYATELIERLGLRRNPALAMVEISNESSLLAAWYRHEWRDATPPEYVGVLEAQWRAWLTQRYGSLTAACAQWADCLHDEAAGWLLTPDDLDRREPALAEWLDTWRRRIEALTGKATGRPPDPLARLADANPRVSDFLEFLADTDAGFYERMRTEVREAAGFDVAVGGTQVGYGGPLNHSALAGMDFLDDHFYVDHPHFPEGHAQPRNWRVWHTSLMARDAALLLRHALRREAGKPFLVTELNHPFPSLTGGELLPIMTTLALRQDWDGLFFYEYVSRVQPERAPANFSLEGDWGKWVQFAQMARVFHQRRLAPLDDTHFVPLSLPAQIALTAHGHLDDLSDHARLSAGLQMTDVWRTQVGVVRQADDTVPALRPRPTHPATPFGQAELQLNPAGFAVTSPQWLTTAGSPHNLKQASQQSLAVVDRATPLAPATFSLTQESTQPNEDTWRLTIGSVTLGSQPGASPPRPKAFVPHPLGSDSWTLEPDPDHPEHPSGTRYTTAPAWLPRQPVTLHWAGPDAQRLIVYPLGSRGDREAPLPAERVHRQGEHWQVDLHVTREESRPWYDFVLVDQEAK